MSGWGSLGLGSIPSTPTRMKKSLFRKLKERDAIKKGHFVLSCGRHTDTFVGITEITSDPTYLEKLASEIVSQISFRPNLIVGSALSGILFGGLLAIKLKTKFIYAERINNDMVIRRGFPKYIYKGCKVIIADDVITSGRTVSQIKELVLSYGAVVEGVVALWKREVVDFDGIPCVVLEKRILPSWEASKCILCKQNIPITLTSNMHGEDFLEQNEMFRLAIDNG